MTYKIFSILKIISFCIIFFNLTSYSFGEPDFVAKYIKSQLEGLKELGIDTSGNIADNTSKYYKKMFGEHFEFKKLCNPTLRRACNEYPLNPDNMDLFKDMMIAPYTPFINWDFVYLAQKYRSDPKTLDPKRYYLAKSSVLSDMLYWEWIVEDIQLRKLESKNGMLLFIKPKDFDVRTGIMGKKCIEILMQVTKISCNDPNELQKQFHFPTILHEGDIFSNIPNFEKLTNDFPLPTDPDQWRKQLVGFISNDGICLILVHGRFPKQSIPAKPTILDMDTRWLSGRILYKSNKQPVLPRGIIKMPEAWKPVLEDNIKYEKWGLEVAEKQRLEEAKWRVWNGKDGKPLNNGAKMRFEYWYKSSVRPMEIPDNLPYKDGVVALKTRSNLKDYVDKNQKIFSLSQFSREDQKQITSVPPKKFQIAQPRASGEVDAQGNIIQEKPKPIEPEPDDIE
jgi:hypothetical protein